MSEQIQVKTQGPTGPCAGCSEFIPLRAEVCPLCEGPTGFGFLTRLRANPRRVFKFMAIATLPVLLSAFLAGRLLGASRLAETKAFLEQQPEIDDGVIGLAREAELKVQAQLRQEITKSQAQLTELGPQAEEAKSLSAELQTLEPGRIRKAQHARQAAFDEIFQVPR